MNSSSQGWQSGLRESGHRILQFFLVCWFLWSFFGWGGLVASLLLGEQISNVSPPSVHCTDQGDTHSLSKVSYVYSLTLFHTDTFEKAEMWGKDSFQLSQTRNQVLVTWCFNVTGRGPVWPRGNLIFFVFDCFCILYEHSLDFFRCWDIPSLNDLNLIIISVWILEVPWINPLYLLWITLKKVYQHFYFFKFIKHFKRLSQKGNEEYFCQLH